MSMFESNKTEMKKLLLLWFSCGIMINIHAQVVQPAKVKADNTLKTNKALTVSETTMNNAKHKLILAEQQTKSLFKAVADRGLIKPGKHESELNDEIVKLAKEEFGLAEHWHKKIVRAGVNTLESYSKNPPDRIIQTDDIVFLDFGPIFEGWEADIGRTYVIGNDPLKLKLKGDVEHAWQEASDWYKKQTHLTGAEFFNYLTELARRYGYEFGGEIGGHIIGHFPHEQPDQKGDLSLDVHPDNHNSILSLDKQGNRRQWVLEIQFIDKAKGFGAFYEQMLN